MFFKVAIIQKRTSILKIIKNPIALIVLLILILILILVITLNYYQIIKIEGAINHLISIISIVAGLLLIVWQISEQHNNSLKAQDEGMKQKIKLDVFSELDLTLKKCQNSLVETGTSVLTLPQKFDLRIFQQSITPSFQAAPVNERAELLTNMHFTATRKLSSVVMVLEKYEIMFPDDSVKKITSIKNKDIEKLTKCFTEFLNFTRAFLPINVPEDRVAQLGKVYSPTLPNKEQLENLKGLSKNYHKQTIQMLGYIYDIRRESQNYFLSSSFDRQLPPRKPTDPNAKVISFYS